MRRRKEMLSVSDRISKPPTRFLRNGQWIDPYPEIHGTVPEKMVYAELTRRGIPFLFLNDINFVIPEIDFNKWYQADFVMPQLKLIIEVQGAFWHSKPEALEADAFKLAVYESTGWKALAWWDFDILERLQQLFDDDITLRQASSMPTLYGKSAELPVQRRTKVDTSKGIRTLNQKRFRAKLVSTGRRKIRKATGFYESR